MPKQTESSSSQTLEKQVKGGEVGEVNPSGKEPKVKRKFHRFRRGKKLVAKEGQSVPSPRLGSYYVSGGARKVPEDIREDTHLEGFQHLEGVEFLRPGTEIGSAEDYSRKFGKDLLGQEFEEPLKMISQSKDFKRGDSWTKGKEKEKEVVVDKAPFDSTDSQGTAIENRADLQGMKDKEKRDEIMEKLEGNRELDPTKGDDDSDQSIESAVVPESMPEGDVSKTMFPTTHVPAQGAQPIKGVIIPDEATDKTKLEALNKMLESEVERKSQEPYVAVPSQVIINETTKVDEARDAARDLKEETGKEAPSS
jgi:hypothetical protein